MKILIDHCANVNSKDNNESTPLHQAALKGNFKTIVLEIQRNKKFYIVKRTFLHILVGHRVIVPFHSGSHEKITLKEQKNAF